jgi:hypothetical protein
MDFFDDLRAHLTAADRPDEQGAQQRAALIRRLVERVEIDPDGASTQRGAFLA